MDAARLETDPRIRTRRETIARSRRLRFLWRVGAVALCVLIAWIAFWSPVLSIRKVRLLGGKHTHGSDIVAAAGLKSSDNLLLVSTDDVARAAETLPWVARAKVKRVLPGTLRVKVIERTPAMALTLGVGNSTSRWLLDEDGRVLSEERRAFRKLPVLAGMPVASLEPGKPVGSEPALAALSAFASMPSSLQRKVVAVFAPTPERLTFTLRDRTLVRFGSAENLAAKNSVLRSVLGKLASQGRAVAYIDVRVPSSPAVSQQAPPDVLPTPGATPDPTA
jgi:cell division protein FtsQ